ncbi:MAG: EpsG family protein [Eubacterium sp.]|nr:EpsG family protein [Eubacterium sp.]
MCLYICRKDAAVRQASLPQRLQKITMAIYYITISILTGLGFFLSKKQPDKKTTFWYLTFVFAVLTLLSSFRYAIGFDYFSYRSIYEMTAAGSFCDILYHCWYEPLFFVVCKGCSLLGMPFQMLLAAVSCFVLFTAMWFIFRYSKLPWLSVYLYITLQFLAYDMNLMRQAIAVSFFLLAFPMLESRKLTAYTLFLFIGGLFHNSLWFVYPLSFLLVKKLSRKAIGCLLFAAVCGYLCFDPLFSLVRPILPEKYAIYQETYFWNSNNWEYLVLPAIYLFFVCLFQNRIQDEGRRTIYFNSALFYFVISAFITKHFILERFAVYPFVFSLIAIPDFLHSYQKGCGQESGSSYAKTYACVMLLFLVFGGAFFLFAAFKGFHHVYPYVSLLDRSRSAPIAAY